MRPSWLARLAPLAFIPLALLYLWPLAIHPNWVAYPPGSNYTDLLLSHLPNALYWRDSLAHFGQWPLWNGQIYGGLPFAADPLAGIWYPPALALLALPLPLGFNLLLALHLAWGGYGLFRFLRAEGLPLGACVLGAVAFAGTPKLVAHLGAGHVSLVYAVAWTPWLLLAVRPAASAPGATRWRGLARGAVAGATLAIIFLADVRWAYYAGMLALAFWVVTSLGQGATRLRQALATHGMALFGFGLFFVLVSAVLALPLAQLVRLSSRSALTLADGGVYSLDPKYLIGLVIPDLHGFHEWMTYVGVVPLLLGVAGVGRRTWFWAALALVAAAYSLGTNFVVFPLAFRFLPLAALLRVPPRAWFLVDLSVAVLAAHGLRRLLDDWLPLLARRYAALNIKLPSARAVTSALIVLTVLDLVRVDSTLLDVRPIPVVPAAAWLAQQPGLFRVYSPTFSLPYGDVLQHVDGVDPVQLTSALSLIEPAIGVRAAGYSVVVPAYSTEEVARGIALNQPDAVRLAALDVKYVASDFVLTGPGFEHLEDFGATHIYLNLAWMGRAWVEGQAKGVATITFWSPNRVDVQATGPGQLVLSEINYPGWQVRIDGQPAQIENAQGALRAVQLPAGRHAVTFEFRPLPVYIGGALSLLGLAALALVIWTQLRA
jgi:Bacterial membrane protein YfhO